ncbi:hypothetical protein [Goodfellowiella coeruleoviolacea]|uniref:Uncharacterized protein n=1 Tax=Goodfellowiella coeruleoviolacea TaxID=334858 RepID=A0AAE3KKH2_9PSEU|nr:hypothetical protein [Goodfellowiella coeruleoviolacea]MCP2165428.1 hypothetical protein [Goodfellowiella coeruleoviolacea]
MTEADALPATAALADSPVADNAVVDSPVADNAVADNGVADSPVGDTVLLVLSDRDDARQVAEDLVARGWRPGTVHRDMLAGEDDAEDVDWVVELATAPDGRPASALRSWLDELADRYDGFTSDLS